MRRTHILALTVGLLGGLTVGGVVGFRFAYYGVDPMVWNPYHYKDRSCQVVSVDTGHIEERDRWITNFCVFAWLLPTEKGKSLTNYLQVLFLPRSQPVAPPVQKAELLLLFEDLSGGPSAKPLTVSADGWVKVGDTVFLQIVLDMGPRTEDGRSRIEINSLTLRSTGSEDNWPTVE